MKESNSQGRQFLVKINCSKQPSHRPQVLLRRTAEPWPAYQRLMTKEMETKGITTLADLTEPLASYQGNLEMRQDVLSGEEGKEKGGAVRKEARREP